MCRMEHQSDRKKKFVNVDNGCVGIPLEEFAGREMPASEAVFVENGTIVVECG